MNSSYQSNGQPKWYREWKIQQNSTSMVTTGAEDIPVEKAELRSPNYKLGSSHDKKYEYKFHTTYKYPKGVAVEMLKNFNGKKDLLKDCPAEVRDLLHSKSAFDIYNKFVDTIYHDKHIRKFLGHWKDAEFVSQVNLFRDDFAEKGIKVALCMRSSDSTNVRWLEFIDVEEVGNYVPQFDLCNMSGQCIQTTQAKLQFPNGVAVKELKNWGDRDKHKEMFPYGILTFLKEHNIMDEYYELVSDFVTIACGEKNSFFSFMPGPNENINQKEIDTLKKLVNKYDETFGKKGIDLFISHKREDINNGDGGGHTDHYRWIEFVDRNEQPNYIPEHDVNNRKKK